jgi:hypothetical protein
MSRLRWTFQGVLIAVLIGFTVFLLTPIFYVQEMLAALILFAVLFSCVAAVVLTLFLLDRAARSTIEFLELRVTEALHHAHYWRTAAEPRSRI